jgi:ABC-type Fe3+/spermidine/putrescine transport system ATPase subunit
MADVPDIELKDVSKRFKDVTAVDHVSLQVPRGAFYSLLGPSGCGKTTTLRIIAGLESADEGEVRLRGQVVNNLPPFKRNLGMVFQGLALFPHLSVFENVAYGLRVRHISEGKARKRVKEHLGLVGLEGLGTRRISQLSGGQQQRVALARALVTEPSVLLLDEPLGALDLKLRMQMQIELKRVHRQVGTTFVFVTHDQGEAMAMSDHIAVMSKGKVDQEGTPDEIYYRPKTAFVADFIGETNLIEATLTRGTVELPGGVALRPPEGIPIGEGDRVIVSLRPESVRVGEAATSSGIRLEGNLEEVAFRGTTALIHVRIAEQLRLTALVEGHSGTRLTLGSRLAVGFNPDAVRMFPITPA